MPPAGVRRRTAPHAPRAPRSLDSPWWPFRQHGRRAVGLRPRAFGATLTELAAYAQEQVERLTRMQQDLAACIGEGESPGGLVSARTGPGGRLLDLRLNPDAMRLSTQDAAAEITAAVLAAQTDYASRA